MKLRPAGTGPVKAAFYWRFPQWSNCDLADLVLTHSVDFCSLPTAVEDPPLTSRRNDLKRTIMRTLIGAVGAILLISTAAAFAGQTEGLIKKVDKDTLTLTLDDGKSYKLNAETDLDALKPGMDIVIAYDVTNGENVVTDMQLPDSDQN